MKQGKSVGNISPGPPDDQNINVWSGAWQPNTSPVYNASPDTLSGNYNRMYGPQYADILIDENVASGRSAVNFGNGEGVHQVNNSVVRNIPPGQLPKNTNLGIGMQHANPSVVRNVPSGFSPGYHNSTSMSMSDNVRQGNAIHGRGDRQWNYVEAPISEMELGNSLTGNSFPRNYENYILGARPMEAPRAVNMRAQTSFGNARVGDTPGDRQWSQAVLQNTPKVRFVDQMDANTFIQQ